MAKGSKRGIIISLIIHSLIIWYLIHFAQTYYVPKGIIKPYTRVSLKSAQGATVSAPSTLQGRDEPTPLAPAPMPTPAEQPSSPPATALISAPSPQESSVPSSKRVRRQLSSAGWYKTDHNKQDQSLHVPHQRYGQQHKEHPLLSTVTKVMQRQQRELAIPVDEAEMQNFLFEVEAYKRKLIKTFKQASHFFSRTRNAETHLNCIVHGSIFINDDGVVTEVRLSTPSGDHQTDAFIKEFFMSPQAPPLSPRLRGKPFTCTFTVQCSAKAGHHTMQMYVQE